MALHVVLTYLSSINGADVFKYLPHAVAAMTLNIFNNITSTHHTFYSLKPSSLNNAAVLDGNNVTLTRAHTRTQRTLLVRRRRSSSPTEWATYILYEIHSPLLLLFIACCLGCYALVHSHFLISSTGRFSIATNESALHFL